MGTAIVLIILLVVVSLVIRSIIKDKKNGKSITCGGDCKVPLIKCSTYFIAKRLACAGLFVVAWFRERTGKAVESPGCECYNDSGK